MTLEEVLEIFNLKDAGEWDLHLHKEIYEPPQYLSIVGPFISNWALLTYFKLTT
jgi:hypothetical protein